MSSDVLFYLAKLLGVLASTIGIYLFVLLVRVLLSWFPNLDWGGNPALSAISSIADPYLNTFRGIIPPLGGLDLSAILAFIVLNQIHPRVSHVPCSPLNLNRISTENVIDSVTGPHMHLVVSVRLR